MKKFEYRVRLIYKDTKPAEEVLNHWGEEGFELVAIAHIPRPAFEDVELIGYFKKTVEVKS